MYRCGSILELTGRLAYSVWPISTLQPSLPPSLPGWWHPNSPPYPPPLCVFSEGPALPPPSHPLVRVLPWPAPLLDPRRGDGHPAPQHRAVAVQEGDGPQPARNGSYTGLVRELHMVVWGYYWVNINNRGALVATRNGSMSKRHRHTHPLMDGETSSAPTAVTLAPLLRNSSADLRNSARMLLST